MSLWRPRDRHDLTAGEHVHLDDPPDEPFAQRVPSDRDRLRQAGIDEAGIEMLDRLRDEYPSRDQFDRRQMNRLRLFRWEWRRRRWNERLQDE